MTDTPQPVDPTIAQVSWSQRVGGYVDRLRATNDSIAQLLSESKVNTINVAQAEVDASTIKLTEFLTELERRIAEREELLSAADAPSRGVTLTEKLRASMQMQDHSLADQCEVVSALIRSTHEQAVSLFVCQYQLADFSEGTIRLLAGGERQQTYSSRHGQVGGNADQVCSGGLFDDAA